MRPYYSFSEVEHRQLVERLGGVTENPYRNYSAFANAVSGLAASDDLPPVLRELCSGIYRERLEGVSDVHVLRNCPIDPYIPELGSRHPIADKYERKCTFVAEAFLALFSRLTGTPLLAYGSRNNGDFFVDVVAIEKYSGMQTGFSDSELMYHNDRTAHAVRADFVSLLGLRCPGEDLIYTAFVDGRNLLRHLSPAEQETLRQPHFITPFDVFSRETNRRQVTSGNHAILENHHSFRYYDTTTTVAPDSPVEARDALIALMHALAKAERVRHRLLTGDLLVFANQDGLHNREKIEINDPEGSRKRWLLKTYAFRDMVAARRHAHTWLDGVQGRIAD
jgi:L-asparagine oxygenase